MPPIEGAKGVGRLDLSDLTLTIDGARTLNLTIPAASVHIDDLSIPDHQDADIHVTVVGEVAEALKLLDYEPLRFPSKFGMKPGDVLGQSETEAHFTFPLVDDLGLDDVKFEADADLKNVNLPHLFAGSSTDHGTFALHVDPAGLFARGTLSINTVPFEATWAENFRKGVTNTSSYTLAGVLDDAAWARFHLPFDERIAGSSPVTLTLIGKGQTISDGRGHLDLTPQQMSLGELGWEKKAGDAAGLDFTFKTSHQGLAVTSYTLRAPALNATGALTLKPDFSLIHARVNMGIGASAMSLDVYGQEDGGFEVFADGGTIDLKPMLSFVRAAQTESRPVPSLAFGGHFTRGLMRNGVELKDIVVDARFIQGWWEKGLMLAEFGDGEGISFSLDRDGTTRVLDITSSNAGEILKGLDYYASGQGGRADITAMIDDSREGSPVSGRARVNDIIIRKAPVMAKLLTLASFTGIADTLSGEGIRFEKVDIPFSITDGVMRLKDAGAYGPAIGLTVEGLLDRNKETVDLGGSIIPSYTLNSFLGKIPLIGPLFSGREGEGLIGFTYRVTGAAANPTVAVNPLSALAPGFLRGIFREMDPPPSGKPEEAPAGRSAPVQ